MATGRTAAELIFIYACLHVEAKKHPQKRRGGGDTDDISKKSKFGIFSRSLRMLGTNRSKQLLLMPCSIILWAVTLLT